MYIMQYSKFLFTSNENKKLHDLEGSCHWKYISLITFHVLISFIFYYDNKVITQWWKKCHHKPVYHDIRKIFKKLSQKNNFIYVSKFSLSLTFDLLTLPISTSLQAINITRTSSSHTILQKSSTVVGSGPWEAI